MKTTLLFQKCLFVVFIAALCGLGLNGCGKEDSSARQADRPDDLTVVTRGSEFHWKCAYCGYENGGWRDRCSKCSKEKSEAHGRLILTFSDVLKKSIDVISNSSGGPINDSNIGTRIELPGQLVLAYGPSNWFEMPKALKFYNDLKTLNYYSNAAYAEGVDYSWYRTVRILYPNITILTTAQKQYDRWILSESRYLKDSFGQGLVAGSKAALDAFGAR